MNREGAEYPSCAAGCLLQLSNHQGKYINTMSSFGNDSNAELSSVLSSITPSQSASQSASQPISRAGTPNSGDDNLALLRKHSIREQLENIDETNLPSETSALPKIWINTKPYVKADWLHRKRKRWSKVDEYGERFVKLDRDNNPAGDYWLCTPCMTRNRVSLYATSQGSTSTASKHLKTHGIDLGNETSDAGTNNESVRRQKTLHESLAKTLITKTTSQHFKDTLLGWLVDSNIPFDCVEHPLFRQLLSLLNKDLVQELLPRHGTTIKAWLKAEYESERETIKTELRLSPYQKHLTFDLWTSPNYYALLGITVHFTDNHQQLQYRLLGLRRISGTHSGENMAPILHRIIEDFAIQDTLGYLTADNADSCDLAVRELVLSLMSSRNIEATTLADHRRIRCINHILNVIATSFLSGTFKEAMRQLPSHSSTYKSLQEETRFLEAWRQSGPMQRLHNLTGWIRRSTQRREQFLQLTRGELSEEELVEFGVVLWDTQDVGSLMVQQENDTRWNSFFQATKRAFQLKDPLEIFQRRMSQEKDAKKRLPSEYSLCDDDWVFLTLTLDILEPFFRLTKRFEGREPRITEVAASLHYLLDHLRWQRTLHSENITNHDMTGPEFVGRSIFVSDQPPALHPIAPPNTQSSIFSDRPRRTRRLPARYREGIHEDEMPEDTDLPAVFASPEYLRALQASLTLAIMKVEKYVAALDRSPVYWASMILHPGLKKRWIEKHLPEREASNIFRNFQQFYEQNSNMMSSNSSHQHAPFRSNYLIDDDFYDKPEDLPLKDELTDYFSMPLLPVDDPLEWWRQHQSALPRLSKMAFDVLSIPATSCEIERVFSQSKLVISSQRTRLLDDTVELLVCLKQWFSKRGA